MSLGSKSRALRRRSTDAERRLWYLLRARRFCNMKFRRQHRIGPYIVDFVCLNHRIVIEVDGGQHLERTPFDHARDRFLTSEGFRVLRLWNNEVLCNDRGVLERILASVVLR